MAPKVHPQVVSAAAIPIVSNMCSAERKRFTLWMKSLIFHGCGLSLFDSDGKVVYRIDNYGEKCSHEVLLMDLLGQVVFTIRRKSQGLRCPCWEGYKGSDKNSLSKIEPAFRVKEHRSHRLFGRKSLTCEVMNKSLDCLEHYKIVKSSSAKLECKIMNVKGKTIAELKQKQGRGGVSLGRDVLSLEVEAEADVSLVVALVAVFGLINGHI
ncbi:hypothetical protein QQ045_020495 [Rhodiola kirilowii]